MHLPRTRLTIRLMLIVVAVAAIAAWLVVTADRVRHDPHAEEMSHLRLCRDTAEVVVQSHPIQGVFWSR